ncbi:MAG: polymer-forming cytoskeletal protein [Candidatus Latescibacterota bacterium]
MWRRRARQRPLDPGTSPTVLGAGSSCTGYLQAQDSVRLDGHFQGPLSSPGRLTVGPQAAVDGEVTAAILQIQGQVHGPARAQRVELGPRAHLVGDIHTQSLQVAPGAVFCGQCWMERAGEPPAPQKRRA